MRKSGGSLPGIYNTLKNPVSKQEIDLGYFTSGIYFMKIQNNLEQRVFKVIVE